MAWTDEVIRKGDKGDLVLNVQKGLLFLGYDCGPADGIYGAKTLTAVQEFQKKSGLDVDGICGPLTGKKLEDVYWAKAKGNPKAPIQPEPAADKASIDAAVAAKKAAAKAAAAAPVKGAPVKGAPAAPAKMPPKK